MTTRSNRATVRNPILTLPAVLKLQRLPRPLREALCELLYELGDDATARADQCWKKHKAPMAAYWKAVAVYSRHIARAVKAEPQKLERAA
ncbi:MAG: hypothetical protein AAF933_12410 [Pseudomonadota bacterium]